MSKDNYPGNTSGENVSSLSRPIFQGPKIPEIWGKNFRDTAHEREKFLPRNLDTPDKSGRIGDDEDPEETSER